MLSNQKTKSFYASIFVILLGISGFTSAPEQASDLVGAWEIDLRPTPDAPPYIVMMNITSVNGNEVKGTFYGSPIVHGSINTQWGKVVFAFVTEDGSGEYHTAGELKDGVMTGSTHSIGRAFVSPWTAKRKQ